MLTIKNEDVLSADLLSIEEAKVLPRWILANGDFWWLRSPGIRPDIAAGVIYGGAVDSGGDLVSYSEGAVRPTFTIKNLPKLRVGELVEVFGYMAQYIGGNRVLLCESVFKSMFDKKFNNYEKSYIKKRVDKWFKKERRDNG